MPLTAEQIAERTQYIGGSDAAAILGLSRWKTPLEVWAEKTGEIDPKDLKDSLPAEVGSDLEDVVAKLWTRRTGKQVRRVNETLTHPNYPFIRANIDRRVVGEDTILECKTAGAWKAKEWEGEEIPQEYIIQALHYLAVTGKEKCELAVLIGGNIDFIMKTVRRDPKVISEIVHKEADFWTKYIEPKIMPQLLTANDKGLLFKLFPNGDDGEAVQLSADANALIESIEKMKVNRTTIENIIEKESNELRLMLGDNTFGVTDRFRVSWKNQTTKRLDTDKMKSVAPEIYDKYLKATESRVLRIAPIKVDLKNTGGS